MIHVYAILVIAALVAVNINLSDVINELRKNAANREKALRDYFQK